jgi:type IV fimbrial biogenesis protein FimT
MNARIPTHTQRLSTRGVTLIELMIAIALMALLVALVVPSFRDMIVMQRLRGVNAQFVTDMQYARSEAISRNRVIRIRLATDAAQTCYSIFTLRAGTEFCDCRLGAGAACSLTVNAIELRTVSVPREGEVTLVWPALQRDFGYDPVTGGLVSIPNDGSVQPAERVEVDSRVDDSRRLRNEILESGRPTVCAPDPTRMGIVGC